MGMPNLTWYLNGRPLTERPGKIKIDVELSCVVPEGPETKTQWFKDGKPIKVPSDKYDEKVVGNKRILVVKSASVEDQGQFACETPKFKSSANLQVTTKPLNLLEPIKDVSAHVGGNATFKCKVPYEGA